MEGANAKNIGRGLARTSEIARGTSGVARIHAQRWAQSHRQHRLAAPNTAGQKGISTSNLVRRVPFSVSGVAPNR